MVKQVIVMRKDLNMRKGKMVAQGAHASMKVFWDISRKFDGHYRSIPMTDEMEEWLDGRFTKVVVGCGSEEELDSLYNKAQVCGLPCSLIVDAGLTEFNGVPTKTCCAIGPANAEDIDKITGELRLL